MRRPRRCNEMRRVFGVKKERASAPTVEEATQRINKRGDTIDEKIKKLDGELFRYREQIKKTRSGPTQEAIKARAIRILKQKKMYENQRDQLYSQTFNLEQVAFATEGLKDAQQTMSAMKAANKDLKGTMKSLKMDDIDKMQGEMMDLVDYSSEIQETLGRSYGVPDDLDEEELMGELDALEADMGLETEEGMPSYLQDDKEDETESDINLPAAPSGHAAQPQAADEYGFPTVPRTSIRT
ncbi:hypothetical protein KC19_VG180200 [Ceratodon purpureus]|uniref:Charged multivesicular body protein 5 n=1 Tax=Ceratodon purpureus TaxID=3225 RepID=A0A8T0HR51_CERPU|nr:hypothetical protein KC19_VG180200 [Ceratodon purpureus]